MGVARQPALRQPVNDMLQHVGREWRIEKHDVVGRRNAIEKSHGIGNMDFSVRSAQPCECFTDVLTDQCFALDERHVSRAARERFDTQCAAAGEQIQTTRPDNRLLQPVE